MTRRTPKPAKGDKPAKGPIHGNTEKVLLIGGSIAGLVGLFLLARSQGGGAPTDQSNGPAYLLGGGGQGSPYYQDLVSSGGAQAPSQGATGTPSAPTTQPGATGPLGTATNPGANTGIGNQGAGAVTSIAGVSIPAALQHLPGNIGQTVLNLLPGNRPTQGGPTNPAYPPVVPAPAHPGSGGLITGLVSLPPLNSPDPSQPVTLPVSNPIQQIQGLLGMGAVTGISAPTVTGTKVAVKQGLANVGQQVKIGAASGLRQATPRKI